MKLLRRIVFGLTSCAFTLVLIAAANSPRVVCDLCLEPPPFDSEVTSAVRIIDCTSISLAEGPYLPSTLRDQLVERAPVNEAVHGEILYAPNGSLLSMRVTYSSADLWLESGDSEMLYPLGARSPAGACDAPTRVSFRCNSETSRCELNAAPA